MMKIQMLMSNGDTKCCKQRIKNSYCSGEAGIEAAEGAANLMKANINSKETLEGKSNLTTLRALFSSLTLLVTLSYD